MVSVTATAVAEAPTFSGPTSFTGSEEGSIALTGVTVSKFDSDDTLAGVTITGLSSGWTLIDTAGAGTTYTGTGAITGVPVGVGAKIQVNVEPVPGETNTENNKSTYIAQFGE